MKWSLQVDLTARYLSYLSYLTIYEFRPCRISNLYKGTWQIHTRMIAHTKHVHTPTCTDIKTHTPHTTGFSLHMEDGGDPSISHGENWTYSGIKKLPKMGIFKQIVCVCMCVCVGGVVVVVLGTGDKHICLDNRRVNEKYVRWNRPSPLSFKKYGGGEDRALLGGSPCSLCVEKP